jgi:hypothetical protein
MKSNRSSCEPSGAGTSTTSKLKTSVLLITLECIAGSVPKADWQNAGPVKSKYYKLLSREIDMRHFG